ncbi:hypothetical protein A2U01_0117606, partial [Trifolium medium]|nr:hypothetical protein [Trifolium medium]
NAEPRTETETAEIGTETQIDF